MVKITPVKWHRNEETSQWDWLEIGDTFTFDLRERDLP
jgi:hypothetical protein